MISVLLDEKDFCVAVKPVFTPVEPDLGGTPDMLSLLSAQLGTELYLIHRLDLPVGGVLVFAKNAASAAVLGKTVRDRGMKKEYFAIVEGTPADEGVFFDYVKKTGSRAAVADAGDKDAKAAELSYSVLTRGTFEGTTVSLVAIQLKTGRFHQIRLQFSSRGYPLLGDGKYGSHKKTGIALFASSLSFTYHGKNVRVFAKPQTDTLPFSIFSPESYRL